MMLASLVHCLLSLWAPTRSILGTFGVHWGPLACLQMPFGVHWGASGAPFGTFGALLGCARRCIWIALNLNAIVVSTSQFVGCSFVPKPQFVPSKTPVTKSRDKYKTVLANTLWSFQRIQVTRDKYKQPGSRNRGHWSSLLTLHWCRRARWRIIRCRSLACNLRFCIVQLCELVSKQHHVI